MSENRGVLIIGEDAVLKGTVSNGTRVEVRGYLEGGVAAGEVVVHEGGRLFGNVKSVKAAVHGTLQGDVRVKELISIKSTGQVSGNVKYGRLAMEEGAELTARVRNIPPTIEGDLDLTVSRGGTVRITLADINAVDPDDKSENLTFAVANPSNGFVALVSAPKQAVTSFTQAELERGNVLFAHDGGAGNSARFEISVTDASGASSGKAQPVQVAVRA